MEAKGKQNLAELLYSVQSRPLWHFGCENRFLFFFCFKVSKCFSSVGLFVLYIFYISCLFFLLLNQVCGFNKKSCRVIHSLQQTDEITPIDPMRTSGIGCFLTPFILLPPQFLSHLLVFILFKTLSITKKCGARQAFSSKFYVQGQIFIFAAT